jgi:hypothetical protein
LFAAGAVLLIAHPVFAGGRANYVEVASWDTGYQAQYTITNDGPGDLPKWTVAFDLPAGSAISSSWDSVLSRSGQHLVFDNAAWNGGLAPGSATTFGFVVVGLGRPASCKINGGPCDTLAPLAEAPRGRGNRGLRAPARRSVAQVTANTEVTGPGLAAGGVGERPSLHANPALAARRSQTAARRSRSSQRAPGRSARSSRTGAIARSDVRRRPRAA